MRCNQGKIINQHYFLDPAQSLLESNEVEIGFDRLAVIPVRQAQSEVTITFDNGVVVIYLLYPEIAIPKPPAETLPIIDHLS